ncbi:MAG: hypothetical protein ACD_65C00229G0002 [uncultured bacterium]|nr:MAG: hypothetical protein ACD_65C00229G0002 [uncultured bacterium]
MNDQRFLDLTVIEQTLEEYYEENHVYPPAEELLSIFTDLPTDQMDGQINDFGEEYGYTYAVYDNYLGSNQEYILSGLFETDDKETSIWTTGEATLDHPDYRDTGLNNIIFIRYSGAATEENAPKVKVKR